MTHLPPPGLPRFGGGERPPFSCKPPAPLTITMGQRLIFRPIAVPHPNHRDPPPPQTLTYPERRTAALIFSAHPGPFPAIGKGGGGKGQMRCGYLGSVSVRSTDLDFSWEKNLNPYPAQPATGVLGQSPKRVLLTFARTKVSPRRVGVQSITFYKTFPTGGDYKLFHAHLPVGGKRKKPGGTGLSLWTARPRAHPRLRSALRE